MKHIIISFILVFYLSITYAGDDGKKVRDSNIDQRYEGQSKRGLAYGKGKAWGIKDFYEGNFKKGFPHGHGIYTWGNGNIYKGYFSKGKMHGKGILIVMLPSGEKEIQKGYFKKGEYIGKYKKPYKVVSKQGIRTLTFREYNMGDINEVRIRVYANGQLISGCLSITDLNNTSIENRGEGTTLTNVSFPLKMVEVSFSSSGKFSHRLVFEIYKKGNWEINISV
jgi:hypothetical protein